MKEKNMESALSIINKSKILSDEDWESLDMVKEDCIDAFLHSQVFRTETEMQFSVLNDLDFPTPDSKFWQAQREQNVHFHELVMLSYEYRKNLVEIQKLQKKLTEETDVLEQELLRIEIEKIKFITVNQERVAKDRIREVTLWSYFKDQLRPQLKYSPVDVNEHQLESYRKKYNQQVLLLDQQTDFGTKCNVLAQHTKLEKLSSQNKTINKLTGI